MSHGLFYQCPCYISGPVNVAMILLSSVSSRFFSSCGGRTISHGPRTHLNCCIKSLSDLQTPLIIFKSGHSVYRDLWAHRKWSIREHASEFSFTLNEQDSKVCANDTLRDHVISTEPAAMSRVIINSSKPMPKFKSCSVFSADYPIEWVASLWCYWEAAAVAGMIFGVTAEWM